MVAQKYVEVINIREINMANNDELKIILENQIEKLLSSNNKEEKSINEESLKSVMKHLGLSNDLIPLAKKVFELAPKTKVLWLHLCECTGCSESLLRSASPSFDELIFDFISLDYHETLMAANGSKAEELLENLLEEEFILAVEGAVAAIDTFFLTIGAHAESGYEILEKVARKANAIFAIGTCSSFGGIQAAYPNPSKTCGISEVLTQKVVNIPGCPPSDINIVANLIFFSLFKILPELDSQNRPLWAYGKCLHDLCERKAKFESGEFAEHFDDEAAKNGACLFKIGCKGPYTYNNCPKVKFNAKTSWPVASGHGCIACSEKDFWDDFGFLEKPMANAFAYAKFSQKNENKILKNYNLTYEDLKNTIKEDEIVLSLKENSEILYKDEKQNICNFLNFEFESNLKIVLNNISKNKLGAKLVENYSKQFPSQYNFIQENFNEESMPSKDIWKFFELNFILAKGKFLEDKKEFIDYALNYHFKHPSPYDFKLSINEMEAKLDVSKSLRMPLIYLCGGLDFEGIAFSCLKAFGKSIIKINENFKDKRLALNINEELNSAFLQELLIHS